MDKVLEQCKKHKFLLALAVVFAGLMLAVMAFWGSVTEGPMTKAEVDQYLKVIDQNIDYPEAEKAYLMASLKEWGYADDGKQFFMLNLMRYRDELYRYPGADESFNGTPVAANKLYEEVAKDLLMGLGAYPAVWGKFGRPVLLASEEVEHAGWEHGGIVRYPSRRAFFKLFTDPEYDKVAAYKVMGAVVNLVPVTPMYVIPDLRLIIGLIMVSLFCAIGWFRAARR